MAMVKNPFNGNLNSNEIFSSIFNMIISQQVFADNFKGGYGSLTNKVKVDGSLYGDTKTFYAVDVLSSNAWGNDSEAAYLLSLDRPAAPTTQAITLDQFRQIRLTVDNYLSKRAWSTEGTFSNFQDVMLQMIQETKKVYEENLINAYIGTVETNATRGIVEAPIAAATTGLTGVEAAQMEAMTIAETLANLFVDMKDYNRDFNEYGYLRSYDLNDLYVVWNSAYVNKIRKIDLPTIFHNDGLVDKFEEEVLPSRYFGITITSSNIASYSASTPAAGKPINSSTGAYTPGTAHANGELRSLVEKSVTVGGVTKHVFPGDELPSGATCGASKQFLPGEFYIVDDDIICKVLHKESVKVMSAFEVGTSFFNPRSLTENHYLTWGYSAPDYLRNYPIVTVEAD